MKKLILNQKQKDKILEMSKKLFSTYSHQYFRIDSKSSITYPIDSFIDNNILRIGSFGKLDLSIHWVEFCMFELAEAIFNPNPLKANRTLQENLKNFYWNCNLFWSNHPNGIHPVEYLYNEYLKLKL